MSVSIGAAFIDTVIPGIKTTGSIEKTCQHPGYLFTEMLAGLCMHEVCSYLDNRLLYETTSRQLDPFMEEEEEEEEEIDPFESTVMPPRFAPDATTTKPSTSLASAHSSDANHDRIFNAQMKSLLSHLFKVRPNVNMNEHQQRAGAAWYLTGVMRTRSAEDSDDDQDDSDDGPVDDDLARNGLEIIDAATAGVLSVGRFEIHMVLPVLAEGAPALYQMITLLNTMQHFAKAAGLQQLFSPVESERLDLVGGGEGDEATPIRRGEKFDSKHHRPTGLLSPSVRGVMAVLCGTRMRLEFCQDNGLPLQLLLQSRTLTKLLGQTMIAFIVYMRDPTPVKQQAYMQLEEELLKLCEKDLSAAVKAHHAQMLKGPTDADAPVTFFSAGRRL